ncbi:sugar ABC transporter ATP-binding protein [Devosia geojensis]|uniref:Sugar ABC transporter ATP-binding protein n=1 Tax=Devosia geojensis TaxID=443610 RepID=A0A0F5FUM2_9HYPH|nr:sn-glycerol-3-phosphate ABC transporter ATP-binding protein UgpC [Devosia geojensis]KKB12561.1 sugar ABC transporter ATP-binding protein [Devosia geojensis]
MADVSIRRLGKHFGTVKVLKDVSLDIADGQFVVLVGPSGCGKSTLLRTIAGLEEVNSGEIRIADRLVNDVPAKERDIAMVFQSYALYPHMTVSDNMSFSLRLKGVPKGEIKEKVARAAEILDLGHLIDRYPRQLSGGQRQRVAMGRAIVRDPAVFLFDEPLSNLDAKLRVQMRAEIKELHQQLGTTMIYVTHDQVEAMTMADTIVVMRDGVIEQSGSPLELYDRPRNLFVAEFIGSPSMNFLKGTSGSHGFLTDDGVEVYSGVLPAGTTTFGIRPEDMVLDPNGLDVEVVVVEPTGPETHVIGRLGKSPVAVVIRERIEIKSGERIRLLPNPSRAHFFDANGTRLN